MRRDWDPEDIKAAIRKGSETLASLGKPHGLSRQSVALALVLPHAHGEAIIAAFLEISPHRIWPSRYHCNGQRRKPQPRANYRPHRRFGKSAVAA